MKLKRLKGKTVLTMNKNQVHSSDESDSQTEPDNKSENESGNESSD